MKKLLFLALFCSLNLFNGNATVTPGYGIPISDEKVDCLTQISVEFSTGTSLAGLDLLLSQALDFSDGNGETSTIQLSIHNKTITGGVVHVDFTTNVKLDGLSIHLSQQLDFVSMTTGTASTINFIVVDHIIH